MAFTFPSLMPSLSTFFACGSDPSLTSPTTLSLISSYCHSTNNLDYADHGTALCKNEGSSSMLPHQPSTTGSNSGSPSPFKESSDELLIERELVRQAEAITLSLNDENHQKKQPHEQVQENALVDDTLLEQIFEIEKLKMLLEITDHDIEQFHLQQQRLNANNAPSPKAIAASTQANIKRRNEKETFVHPGFYTLSSSWSPTPSKNSRKRSLQENVLEANRARAMTPPEDFSRRHSLEGSTVYSSLVSSPMIPGPLMQSHPPSYSRHWSSYATPPKTPSTPSTSYYQASSSRHTLASSSPLQNRDDLPPGQPLVLAFDVSSSPLFTRSVTSTPNPTTTPYPPPRSDTSPFPAKKRRSSKFKMDPFQLHNHNHAHHEGPLQQQHRHPYHSNNKERQHPLSSSSSPYMMFSTKSTYRHNPAQVPASMIPPDHFVFQEALQKQPWLRGLINSDGAHPLAQQGLSMPTSISHAERGVASYMRPSSTASSSSLSSSPAEKPSTIVIDDPEAPGKDKETRRKEAAAFAASLMTM